MAVSCAGRPKAWNLKPEIPKHRNKPRLYHLHHKCSRMQSKVSMRLTRACFDEIRLRASRLRADRRKLEAGPESGRGHARRVRRAFVRQVCYSFGSVGPLPSLTRTMRRYLGTDPEPRPGLSSGHMPHALSLPFNAFIQSNAIPGSDKTYTTFLSPDKIVASLEKAVGKDVAGEVLTGKRKVTTTCGSGMTAAVLWLGLKLVNPNIPVAVYDEVSAVSVIITCASLTGIVMDWVRYAAPKRNCKGEIEACTVDKWIASFVYLYRIRCRSGIFIFASFCRLCLPEVARQRKASSHAPCILLDICARLMNIDDCALSAELWRRFRSCTRLQAFTFKLTQYEQLYQLDIAQTHPVQWFTVDPLARPGSVSCTVRSWRCTASHLCTVH
jgi:hypothetical protein